jgi:hypothetical protein
VLSPLTGTPPVLPLEQVMPFESKSQWRKCWAMKRRGEAGSWDCKEWADSTKKPFKKLPESKPESEKSARVKVAMARLRYLLNKQV